MLREFKIAKIRPAIYDLEAQLRLEHNLGGIPSTVAEWEVHFAWQIAKEAAIPITRLIVSRRIFCSNVPTCVRQNTVIVDLLHMLRREVVVHNMTVIPKMPILRVVLPLEQHLVTIFEMRAKLITEAENVVKFNLCNI